MSSIRPSPTARPKLAAVETDVAAATSAFEDGGAFHGFSSPALLIGKHGLMAANGPGLAVARDARAAARLCAAAEAVVRTHAAAKTTVPVQADGRQALFEFEIAPWGGAHALALGRDVTVETGVREALELSRERYRALLEIAVDCIWETGADGALELLAPNDIFGIPAAHLIGRHLSCLIATKAPGFYVARQPRVWSPAGLVQASGALALGAAVMEPIRDRAERRLVGYRGCFRRTQPLSRAGGPEAISSPAD